MDGQGHALVWLVALLFLAGCRETRTEEFLLPEGFRGAVVVGFGCRGGRAPAQENGIDLYEIPKTGVLLIDGPAFYGSVDPRYYFDGPDGKRIRIPSFFSVGGDTEEFGISHERSAVIDVGEAGLDANAFFVGDGATRKQANESLRIRFAAASAQAENQCEIRANDR